MMNITIKENGTARNFNNISAIGTRVDSGNTDWVPEDENRTTWKQIDKNGQYFAQQRDGVAGYTAVFINVPLKSIIGKDKNDGHTYEVSVDGSGNIQKRQID